MEAGSNDADGGMYGPDISLHQLRVFREVARRRSYTVAARTLFLSQSVVSRTVQDLEKVLGTVLFFRTSRSVTLTVAGEEFLRFSDATLRSYDVGLSRFLLYMAGESGTVTVAALPSVAALVMPAFILEFAQSNPGVNVQIQDRLSDGIISAVEEGLADIGIAATNTLPPGLTGHSWREDTFVAVLPPTSRLASSNALSWRQLSGEPFIAMDPGSSVRQGSDFAFASIGVSPKVVLEARNISVVGALVSVGLGVSALPSLVVPFVDFAGPLVRPLFRPTIRRHLQVIFSSERPLTPVAAVLLDALLQRTDTQPID